MSDLIERLEGNSSQYAPLMREAAAALADFVAIYRDVWGADDKKDADVCEAFERAILKHNL